MKRPVRIQPASSPFDEAPVLSPFIIGKLARRKGLIVDSVMTGQGGRRLVRFTDVKTGAAIDYPIRMSGFTLYEAKRYLDQLPDRSPRKGAAPT
jgi:hypothetical protein